MKVGTVIASLTTAVVHHNITVLPLNIHAIQRLYRRFATSSLPKATSTHLALILPPESPHHVMYSRLRRCIKAIGLITLLLSSCVSCLLLDDIDLHRITLKESKRSTKISSGSNDLSVIMSLAQI